MEKLIAKSSNETPKNRLHSDFKTKRDPKRRNTNIAQNKLNLIREEQKLKRKAGRCVWYCNKRGTNVSDDDDEPKIKRGRGIADTRAEESKELVSSRKRPNETLVRERKTSLENSWNDGRSSKIVVPIKNVETPKNPNTKPNSTVTSSHPKNSVLERGKSLSSSIVFTNTEYEKMDVDMYNPSSVTLPIDNDLPAEWFEQSSNKVSSFINEIEHLRKDSAYRVRHEDFIADIEMNLSVPSGDLLIVVDTNIFLSHLRFLNSLLEANVATYKTHVLVVPYLVVQEIDYAMKKDNQQLASQARLANNFLFECFKKENSRFFAQSFEDFKVHFKNAASVDDFLLQYCLKLIGLRNNVILLSDDKNLGNKCRFSHVPVYSKADFEKTFSIL